MNDPPSYDPDDADTLELELLKGLETPAREMTKDDWDVLRRRVLERHYAGGDRE